MPQVTVIVNKLNRRRSPVADFRDKSNVVDVVLKGARFESVDEIENVLGKWKTDSDGYYLWAGGLQTHVDPKISDISSADWWFEALQIPLIWEVYEEFGKNAKVAILDTGYDVSNPDIAEAVKDQKVCFSLRSGTKVTINDNDGHGTHCASLIAGRNKRARTGCAPLAELYIAKIASSSLKSWMSLIEGIIWAIEKRVDIISISFGGEDKNEDVEKLEKIIKKAVNEHNILIIASIGDTAKGSANKPCYPALFQDCLATGATNKQNEISYITVNHPKTQVNAPGENITAYWLNGELISKDGTSQSTAIVAGVAALIISRHKRIGKTYTPEQIRKLIVSHGTRIEGINTQSLISPLNIFKNL